MATYVTVHGAWDGAWSWRQVARFLQAAGHDVFTTTRTGSGERAHLSSPDVDLNTHIQDVANVLRYEDLHDVILVGHSAGGVIITGVAEQEAARLARLVYVDAFVPQNGEALADLIPPDVLAWFEERARTVGDGWRIPHDPPDADRRTDFPMAIMYQPLEVRNAEAARLPRAYIACLESRKVPLMAHFIVAAERAQQAGWDYFELPTAHMAQLNMPRELADLLLNFA
jgi:pimeloyl-ACP methyl ester carboxylesterase